ncbi:protein arginine N-methyltransferase 2 isoform X2 [Hyla sarda]|uniref:protein arginine N-methyltransferase 2 isoform X2 n=1 Tax=Hyla sarda TaxID=327740 RepID=UPI0024C279B2|nr:protein arginine N-methyltransferase 2 isoform X2 [Hyla sarda]
METDKIWGAHWDGRGDGEDEASSGEDPEKSSRAQERNREKKEESRAQNTKNMDIQSILGAVQEIERELGEPLDWGKDRNSAQVVTKEPKVSGYGERNRESHRQGDGEFHGVNDKDGRLVSSEVDRAVGDCEGYTGDSFSKRMARDLFREVDPEECLLSRDTRWSGHGEGEGDTSQVNIKDLTVQGGLHGACGPKEPKANMSSEDCAGAACWAAVCPEGSIVDYSYVDFSTNEFMAICDFVAADDTQLSLSQGDKVFLLNVVTEDWWWVEYNGQCGYVPATHLHGVYNKEDSYIDDPWQDEEYYGSYKTLKLHLEMLSDEPRTQAYRNVIIQNSTALKGKRILDLGCGTGIISFFCAQLAEPEIVYAVEASEIAEQTCKLVEENGFSNIIQVVCQRAEELQLPTKVDVLVSEWMGTCLMFEFMLESVLLARDLWLKEDGVMWPSTARIHLVPCSADKVYASKVHFWEAPYGFNFSALKLTHWKHTLFILDKPLQVHMGDKITGSAVFKRNPTWRRHLSVTIIWSVTSSSLTKVQDGCKVFPIWR